MALDSRGQLGPLRSSQIANMHTQRTRNLAPSNL
jgi:hypothetical protein